MMHVEPIVDTIVRTCDLNHVFFVGINKVFGNLVSFDTQCDLLSLSVAV
jgi:hypothetical protein